MLGFMVTGILTSCSGGGGGDRITFPSCHMAPTADSGDSIAAEPLDGDPQRGAVVTFERPTPDDGLVVSGRVIGLPGEEINLVDGAILIDGDASLDVYATSENTGLDGPIVVPDGHVYVLADNRRYSQDSRTYGPVPTESIVLTGELPPEPDAESDCVY